MARKLSEMSGAERVAWLRQQRQKRSIGLDTFEDDLKGVYDSIGGIDGWRDRETMEGYSSAVAAMLKRSEAYRDYYKGKDVAYDSSNIDRVIKGLTEAGDWLSERSDVFGGYGSAEDYDAAVKKYTDAEAKYGGKSSSELKALMESYKISRDAKNRDIDDQITAFKGFLDENRNYLGRAIIPSEAFQKEFGLSDEDFANIYDLDGYLQKVGDVESKVKEKIAALESSRLAKDDAVAQHYYYQALLEELGAKGYSSALRGDYGSGLDRAKNFDYAVRAGADEIGKLVAAQRAASGGSVDFDATGYGELSDDEKSLYLYLADNVGEKAAREYYDYLFGTNSDYNEALAARVGRSASENKNDFERILGSFGSGLSSWIAGNERALKALFGKDDSVVHSFEYEAQFDREALSDNKALTALYDVGTSFGQMAPSVLAGFLTAGQSTGVQLAANVGTFGVSIYGNAYDEALKLGKDRSEAITYGILNAASEVALQNLIGGIPGVGKHLSGEFLTELANKTSSVLLKVAAQVAGDALGEFTEEYLQEVLGQVFRNVAFGENGEVKLFSEEALYSGIIGALTSAGISVPSGAVNLAGLNSVGKLYNVGASETLDGAKKTGVAALIEEGLAADRSSEAYDYAQRLSRRQAGGKDISNLQAGTLAQLLRQAAKDGKSDADTSFSPIPKKNSTKDMHFTTPKLGDVLASLETGKDDPASVVGALGETVPSVNVRPTENVTEDAKDADRLLTENLEKYKGTMDRRFENYGKIQALWDAASGENSGAVASEAVSVNERKAEDQNAVEGKNEGSREVSDGLEGVREDVDTVRRAADSGDSAMAAVYEKYNAELSDRERQNADVFVSDYKLVRDLAAGGRSEAGIRSIIESGNGAGSSLNDEQFLSAYHEGQALYEASGVGKSVDMSRPRRVGKVFYKGAQAVRTANGVLSLPDSGISRNSRLNEDQRAAVDFAEKVLAPMGVDVVFYSSGTNRSLPNGLYDGKYIYIDIEAGMSERASETFVTYALAHELTHLAERMSPELWQRYADAVIEVLAREKGVSVRRLIEKRKLEYMDARVGSLRKTYPEKNDSELRDMVDPLTDDGAIREIVADASQLIFTRESRFAEKLAEKDATLWDKLKKMVLDAIDKLKKVLQGIPRDGVSEHIVGHLDELREYFDDMMADALYRAGHGTAEGSDSESGQKKEKSQATGKVQFQDRPFNESVDLILENKFPRGNYVRVTKTPDFYARIGLNPKLPMLTTATHIYNACQEKDRQLHQHGLTPEQMKRLPEELAHPAMIMDALDREGNIIPDNIIVVTSMVDPDKVPVIVPIKVHDRAQFNDIEVNTNVLKSFYGKDSFFSFIERHIEKDSILYINKNKAELLATESGAQWPERLKSYSFDTIIHKSRAIVKPFVEKNYSKENPQAQDRRVYATTLDRQILATAVENIVQSDADYEIAQKYKKNLASYREMQREIDFLISERERLYGEIKAGRDNGKVGDQYDAVRDRIKVLRETLKNADATLLDMEALMPLRSIVRQERARANKAEKEAKGVKTSQETDKRIAKERQMRSQYLKRSERALTRIYKWAAHPTKKDHVPTEFLPLVKQLFDTVDVSHHFALIEELEEKIAAQEERIAELKEQGAPQRTIDAQEKYRKELEERLKKLENTQEQIRHDLTWKERLQTLLDMMDTVEKKDLSQVYVDFAPGLAEDIQKCIKELSKDGKSNRLFKAEPELLRKYAEALESISHSITEAGRLYANKRAASVEVLAEFTIDEFKHSKREAARSQMLEVPRKLYGLDSLNPAYFAHKLGRGTEAVMDELYDGFYQVINNVKRIDAFSERLKKEYHTENYTGKQQKIHRIMLEQGGSVSLTTGQLMTVAALSDRPQAQKHMFGRGIQSYTGDIKQAIGKVQDGKGQLRDEVKRILGKENGLSEFAAMLFGSSDVHRVTQKDIDRMIGELTAEQQRCVKEIKRFLREDIAAMGNKTSQKLYLYDMFTEETYFPIETVATFRAFSEKQKDIGDKNFNERSIFSVMNKGFTKQLQEQAGNPIVIRDIFDVYMEHCFDMANYAGLGVAVSDTIKWLSYRQKVFVDKKENSQANGNVSSHGTGTYTADRLRRNAKAVLNSEAVAKLTGNEFPGGEGVSLSERVIAFFDSVGNKATHKELGDVALTKSSFRDDKAHGLTRNKVVSFKAVPQVIEKGHVIDVYQPEGKPYERITIAAPIMIGTAKYYVAVMVQRDFQSQRMYLHDIIAEEATLSFNTEPTAENGEGIRDKGHLFITSILQKALSVKSGKEISENYQKTDAFSNDGTTLRDEMEKAWGKGAERYIRNLLMSIEGELKGSDGARVINKLVRNAKIASVAGNMRVVLQQPTAYFRAAAVLSPKAMLNASIHPFDLKKMIKEAEEHSELMYYKSLGFYDMNNSQSLLEKMKGDTSMADRIREWSTAPAGAADMMTWGTLWRACRLEVDAKIKADKLGVEKNSDKYFRMVRDKFHDVINLTQVIDSPMHKNKLMSDPDSLMKQLTAFMAEPMLTLNMVQSAVDDVFRKRPHAKVKLVRASAVFLVSTAATSLMSALADAARDDDEDEGWLEKYFEAALRSATGVDLDGVSLGEILSGDWNLLNNMPIIKEIFSMLEGYDPSRMELSGIGKMVTAMTKLVKLLSGEGGDLEKTMYSVAQAISTVTGIPVSNLWRLVRSMVNTVKAWAQ